MQRTCLTHDSASVGRDLTSSRHRLASPVALVSSHARCKIQVLPHTFTFEQSCKAGASTISLEPPERSPMSLAKLHSASATGPFQPMASDGSFQRIQPRRSMPLACRHHISFHRPYRISFPINSTDRPLCALVFIKRDSVMLLVSPISDSRRIREGCHVVKGPASE